MDSVAKLASLLHKASFSIRGAPNVILETIKRGEDDFTDSRKSIRPKTIVLRIYEAFGGHAQAFLRIFGALPIVKAYETNILEDEGAELNIFRAAGDDNTNDVEIKLNFRGFEFKTVKLVLGDTNGVTAIDECVPHS